MAVSPDVASQRMAEPFSGSAISRRSKPPWFGQYLVMPDADPASNIISLGRSKASYFRHQNIVETIKVSTYETTYIPCHARAGGHPGLYLPVGRKPRTFDTRILSKP
jgi:hypothetical protein